MSDPIDTVTGHAAQPKSTRGATWVTAPQEIVTTSQRTALASSLTNADIGYTVIDSDLTNVASGELSVWVFAGTTAGFIADQRYTNGAASVNVSNALVSYVWSGADDTNAPVATDFPDFTYGVSADGAATGLVYWVIGGAWVATGATVANLHGA